MIDPHFVKKLLGWGPEDETQDLDVQQYSIEEAVSISDHLHLDNVCFFLRPPLAAEKHVGKDGRIFYGDGRIRSWDDLALIELPDPNAPGFWDPAKRFVDGKGDYAAWLVTRLGSMPTMSSLGVVGFSLMLYEDRALVEAVFDRYLEWSSLVAEGASRLGFDALVTTDDVAFGTTTFFSPEVFRDLCLPRYREFQQCLDIPWILHSDGNMNPFLPDITTLDVVAFNPVERAAMDIRETKRDFGDRLCLIGNVDLNTLSIGTVEEVEAEVRGLLRDIAPGGGYILSSGNSLAAYLDPRNVEVMRDIRDRWGTYPIDPGV
jgi:uroporphyrinogen decarboxylase